MPIGISSKRPRTAALASRSRGYHANGVAILRPSASVTTSSSAVKATETGLISPTSISKVLMPFTFEAIALRSQVADNGADFMGEKSRIHRDREVVQPELGFKIAGPDMNMRAARRARSNRRTRDMAPSAARSASVLSHKLI